MPPQPPSHDSFAGEADTKDSKAKQVVSEWKSRLQEVWQQCQPEPLKQEDEYVDGEKLTEDNDPDEADDEEGGEGHDRQR